MRIVTRAEWGARPPTSTGNAIGAHPLGVVVHYSEGNLGTSPDSECDDTVRGIQRYHQDTKGWVDIAYNFLVCPHGNIFEGRGTGKGSAANGTTQGNLDRYAVCALGGPKDTPSALMLTGIVDAIGLCRKAGAGTSDVGHRDIVATACPGIALYVWVKAGMPVRAPVTPPIVVSRATIRTPIPKPLRVVPARPNPPQTGVVKVNTIDLRNAHRVIVTGLGVKPLQRLLGVTADGKAGTNTRAALGNAQARLFGHADFLFGPDTATALLSGR